MDVYEASTTCPTQPIQNMVDEKCNHGDASILSVKQCISVLLISYTYSTVQNKAKEGRVATEYYCGMNNTT